MRLPALILLSFILLAAAPLAAQKWIETKSGPFVVYSDAGEKDARAALYHLEQFRFLFGESLGKRDLRTVWPVTVIVSKPSKADPLPSLGFSRDGWLATWPAGAVPPPAFFRRLALLFIEDNWPARMPGTLEPTFATLFSTFQLAAGKVTLGLPPAPAERTRQWALLQYLLTNPETSTRTRVLLSNLASGADEGTAFRNSFDKPKATFDAEVERYLAAANFLSLTLPAKPLNPEIAFSIVPALPSRIRVLPGDKLMAAGAPPAQVRAAYQQAINERPGPLAFEGLGLALLAENHPAEARQAFETMKAQLDDAPNAYARGLCELGLYDQASLKNPRWAEPFLRAAAKEPGPVRKAYLLKKAAELEPRNPDTWRALAQNQFDAKQFAEAEKSWFAAARAARSDEEREALTRAREAFEQARYDAAAAEKARLRKEEQDEVERLRLEAAERVRRKEAELNKAPLPDASKIEKWWDGPPLTTFTGTLEAVACQGPRARLQARDSAGKPAVFTIDDPSKIVLLNHDQTQAQLNCGPQRPPRRVKIEYAAKPGAPGQVATLEFLK